MTINHAVVAQGAPGTTVLAPAVAGLKHKVRSFFLAGDSGGGSTFRFTSSGTDLMGPVFLDKSPVAWSGPDHFVETAAGQELRLVTTGKAFQGVVGYITEA